MPHAYSQLREITSNLERHYRDMQDFEFTIEEGTLYMLQTRNGKRTGTAAVRVAVDMAEEGLIDHKEAVLRVQPQQLDQLLHPIFDAASLKKLTLIATGIDASPGAAVGRDGAGPRPGLVARRSAAAAGTMERRGLTARHHARPGGTGALGTAYLKSPPARRQTRLTA